MIIPVRCFTCGHVLADKWNYYVKRCKELENEQKEQDKNELNPEHFDKTIRQKVFEELGLDRICCRRMFLGHVDMIDTI